jgi:hypothetical protein
MRHDILTLQQYLIACSVAHPPDPGVFVASLSFQSPPKSQVLFLQTLKERRIFNTKKSIGSMHKNHHDKGTTDDKKHPSNLRGRKKRRGGGWGASKQASLVQNKRARSGFAKAPRRERRQRVPAIRMMKTSSSSFPSIYT